MIPGSSCGRPWPRSKDQTVYGANCTKGEHRARLWLLQLESSAGIKPRTGQYLLCRLMPLRQGRQLGQLKLVNVARQAIICRCQDQCTFPFQALFYAVQLPCITILMLGPPFSLPVPFRWKITLSPDLLSHCSVVHCGNTHRLDINTFRVQKSTPSLRHSCASLAMLQYWLY